MILILKRTPYGIFAETSRGMSEKMCRNLGNNSWRVYGITSGLSEGIPEKNVDRRNPVKNFKSISESTLGAMPDVTFLGIS